MDRYHVALHLVFTDENGHGFTDSARATVEAGDSREALVLAAIAVDVPDGYTVSAVPAVWFDEDGGEMGGDGCESSGKTTPSASSSPSSSSCSSSHPPASGG